MVAHVVQLLPKDKFLVATKKKKKEETKKK